MLVDLILLVFGLLILISGGEILVKAASSLAKGLGVSPLAIGLTVVAFGTSAPELAVNVGAALNDTVALSFGNVFGSNMANIGIIVGLLALLYPLPVHSIVIRRELPMMLLALAAASVLAADTALGGGEDQFSRGDGLILLLFFFVFLFYTVGDLLRRREMDRRRGEPDQFASEAPPLIELPRSGSREPHIGRDSLLSLVGLAALIGGAALTVEGAVGVARAAGVSEVIIGLTLISVGTSLPELVAAIAAVRHGKHDMAVGSVVGSNIFNTLLICGTTAIMRPIPIPEGGSLDLASTAVLSLALTLTASTYRQIIIRYEGLALLLTYLAYITWRAFSFPGTAG